MASNILNIGKSALTAAQVGISTTGHNIANASTPGYTRQVVIQGAALAQNFGYGFIGQGTQVTTVQRVYSELLTRQVASSQSTSGELSTYATQMSQIDNLLANASAGLSPAIQGFFSSLQTAAANPGDPASRQSMLSTAQALASRFQALGKRLDDIGQSVNSDITASVSLINSYARQISQLNKSIEAASIAGGNPPNDLLDQRDQLIAELSGQIKVDVVKQDDGKYNVFIGNGQPLVVGSDTYALTTVRSPTDANRIEVGYVNNSTTVILGSNSLTGGKLGGLVQFREKSLDVIQGQLGLVAIGLAETFNAQHALGYDQSGTLGSDFFSIPAPQVAPSTANNGNADLTATVSSVSALTGSNYRVKFDGSNYTITRTDTGASQSFASLPQTVDGVAFDIASGSMTPGDSFLVKPTAQAATGFSVAITDVGDIALAGLPTAGNGDNENALKLAALQSAMTMFNGTTSFEGAYGQLVSLVGNKTNELKVMGTAEEAMLEGTIAAQQSVSGVNLDEEATNLLRYQQAYQAAAKVMQIASQLFDEILALGR
ncbi:Flagellar hook-associated protein 1 [Methylophilaceae bacterium]|nr:Flagellar hook-associated protein 1 [Methylophilaceae bacterium]